MRLCESSFYIHHYSTCTLIIIETSNSLKCAITIDQFNHLIVAAVIDGN